MTSTTTSKKRKRDVVVHQGNRDTEIETSKPTAVFTPGKPRQHTLSVALPGSVIANALTHEHKTAVAGQIGRALAVFCVDEVIIFDDGQNHKFKGGQDYRNDERVNENEHTGWSDPDHFLCHLLSYLEMPPYLRKTLFPVHPNLRTAGTLPSTDMPHHLRTNEWCQYREGVTIAGVVSHPNGADEETPNPKRARKGMDSKSTSSQGPSESTLVDIGSPQKLTIPVSIPPKTRITLKLPPAADSSGTAKAQNPRHMAEPVHPSAPREEAGYYWGYNVRRSASLSAVFTECPFDGGYDLSIGTSERGRPLSQLLQNSQTSSAQQGGSSQGGPSEKFPTRWKHLLAVFGGPSGIEAAVSVDSELAAAGVKEAKDVFDAWVNVCPGQGSRTIRTEEAVWIGLMSLRDFVRQRDDA
ncbi:MAG: hypothetical protein M1822_000931 [Bathelium mastoideum]|nr:MAG: hypothetical protein M1822_000931 [Bathelium mastoideum]